MNRFYTYLFSSLSLIGFTGAAQAQKTLSTGLVQYDISISSEKPGAVSSALKGAALTLHVTPKESRTDMVSSLGKETTVFNNGTGKGFILKEYSGQKLMITASRANWLDKNKWNDELAFITETGTSTINGYSCKKATAKGQDGKMITVYYTPDIAVSNKSYNSAFSQLPGLPVQYEVSSGNLRFTYKLKTVSYDNVPASTFDEPRQGYRVMTYEENQQLKVKE